MAKALFLLNNGYFLTVRCLKGQGFTFVGHRRVSMSAAFTPASPPTSDQPNSPAVCKLTPLSAAEVNPSKAFSKSSGVIAEQMPPSAKRKQENER